MIKALTIFAGLFAVSTAVSAREEIVGPVDAHILRIIDGDTILVEARPWPQQRIEVYVRIRGIDAPEMKSTCAIIRKAALDARQTLETLTSSSNSIRLMRISGDKYFGRIIADVFLPDGHNVADDLMTAGLAHAYDGGRKPREVCAAEN